MNLEKAFVPIKTKEEKLASIDSSIESCIKIIEQELRNRQDLTPQWEHEIDQMLDSLSLFEEDFNDLKNGQNP